MNRIEVLYGNCPKHGPWESPRGECPDCEMLSDLGSISHDTGDHMRKDAGKPRFDLLPPEPLFALADLYGQGAKKYSARSWEAGMTWGRCFGAMMRHAWKFWRGEDFDEETGAHHMIVVMWNAAAIYTYFVRKIGTDDRYGTK